EIPCSRSPTFRRRQILFEYYAEERASGLANRSPKPKAQSLEPDARTILRRADAGQRDYALHVEVLEVRRVGIRDRFHCFGVQRHGSPTHLYAASHPGRHVAASQAIADQSAGRGTSCPNITAFAGTGRAHCRWLVVREVRWQVHWGNGDRRNSNRPGSPYNAFWSDG